VSEKVTKNAKEELILQASTELFLEFGFKDVSITKIVEKAGCSRETVYRYFSNKEDIFSKIIDNLMERYLSIMKNAIALETDNLRDGLIAWSESLYSQQQMKPIFGFVDSW
jgi:AcrR family transcriptional regulator